VLSEERVRVEPFTTSILDGIDLRETIRKWYEKRIYVRQYQKIQGEVGSVIVIFDEDRDDRYTYTTTWLGEHQNESDMAFYSTDPFSNIVGPWYARVAAIGHGRPIDMTPDQAIDAARTAEPRDLDEWSSEAENIGLRRGDIVSVTPDDYGNPVVGRLLAWKADEVVLRHEDPSVGRVNLHFPRVGFDVVPAQKIAA